MNGIEPVVLTAPRRGKRKRKRYAPLAGVSRDRSFREGPSPTFLSSAFLRVAVRPRQAAETVQEVASRRSSRFLSSSAPFRIVGRAVRVKVAMIRRRELSCARRRAAAAAAVAAVAAAAVSSGCEAKNRILFLLFSSMRGESYL